MDKPEIMEMLRGLTHDLFVEANDLMDESQKQEGVLEAMLLNEKAGGILLAVDKIMELRQEILNSHE